MSIYRYNSQFGDKHKLPPTAKDTASICIVRLGAYYSYAHKTDNIQNYKFIQNYALFEIVYYRK